MLELDISAATAPLRSRLRGEPRPSGSGWWGAIVLAVFSTLAAAQTTLPGTAPLTSQGDLALQMVDAINADLLDKTAQAPQHRPAAPDRERFRKIIGAVDRRLPVEALEFVGNTATPALVAEGVGYKIFAV